MSDRKITLLKNVAEVSSGNEDASATYTPAAGRFSIMNVSAEAAFDMNVSVGVRYNSNVVFLTKGNVSFKDLGSFVSTGSEVVELFLDATNLPSGSIFLQGSLEVIEEV